MIQQLVLGINWNENRMQQLGKFVAGGRLATYTHTSMAWAYVAKSGWFWTGNRMKRRWDYQFMVSLFKDNYKDVVYLWTLHLFSWSYVERVLGIPRPTGGKFNVSSGLLLKSQVWRWSTAMVDSLGTMILWLVGGLVWAQAVIMRGEMPANRQAAKMWGNLTGYRSNKWGTKTRYCPWSSGSWESTRKWWQSQLTPMISWQNLFETFVGFIAMQMKNMVVVA